MIVMKFGGTSVGSAKNIAAVSRVIKKRLKQKPVIVVSAVTKMTDALIQLANDPSGDHLDTIRGTHEQILRELSLPLSLLKKEFKELEELVVRQRARKRADARTLDYFQSFGERMSARIVAAQLSKIGVKAAAFPAWEIGMITDGEFGDAEPLPHSEQLIRDKLTAMRLVPVVTGFIGKTQKNEIVTLGRGGSDYSAAIIGGAIGAEVIEIWTDVSGIMTTDPRIVAKAKVVPELAFEEACELAYFGAKVLHPKTILPAMRKGIPVRVLNTFDPNGASTTIVSNFRARREKSHTVEAFAFKKNITVVHVLSPEFFDGNSLMARIFRLFEKHKTSIDVVATSVVGVSLTIDNEARLEKIISGLSEMGDVSVARNKAIICAVGGSINVAGVAGKMFKALGAKRIAVEMISQASSGISITFVVEESDAPDAIRLLHKEYIGT